MIDLESTIEKIVEAEGASLYDVELCYEDKNCIYRIFITHSDGISLDLCAKISNLLSPILDTNPPTQDNYFLEVSSLGIERKLTKPKHFQNAIGELIKFKYDGEKYRGCIVSATEQEVTIEQKGEVKTYTLDALFKVKTYIEW